MKNLKLKFYYFMMIVPLLAINTSCDKPNGIESPMFVVPGYVPEDDTVYDSEDSVYKSYNGLVMAGYQGWFAAEGDDSDRGWYHYQNGACGGFTNSCSSIDMWPDMTEYENKYITPYKNSDGSDTFLFSSFDEQTVDTHFRWMQENTIDGVHMQRFLAEVIDNERGKRHFDRVLRHALKAAKKYGRAISIMYDLSGSDSDRIPLLQEDWNELVRKFRLNNNI